MPNILSATLGDAGLSAEIERVRSLSGGAMRRRWQSASDLRMRQRGGKRVRMSITSPLMQLSPNGWGGGMGNDR